MGVPPSLIVIHLCHEWPEPLINHATIESLSEYLAALWSPTWVLRWNLSLILTAFRGEIFVNHSLVVWKFIDVCSFHVLVLDGLVIWLELSLDLLHFSLNLNVFFNLQLSFKMLRHVARVLWLQNLLVHDFSLALEGLNIRVVSFLMDTG